MANWNKRNFTIFTGFLGAFMLFGAPNSNSQIAQNAPKEYFLGDPNAKVTLLEYGSLTCSHCGDFAREIYPQIHQKYVVTGKVKYVFRTLPTQPVDLSLAMQLLADCSGNKRYQMIEEFFRNQNAIFSAAEGPQGPLPILVRLTKSKTGLEKQALETCLNDSNMRLDIIKKAQWGDDTYKITGTPAFIINGKLLDPKNIKSYDMPTMSAAIDKALAEAQKPKAAPKKK